MTPLVRLMIDNWTKALIAGTVGAVAVLAASWFAGCSLGAFKGDSCKNAPRDSIAVLVALLTTVTSLAVKAEAPGPGPAPAAPPAPSPAPAPVEPAPVRSSREVVSPD